MVGIKFNWQLGCATKRIFTLGNGRVNDDRKYGNVLKLL